MPHEVELIATIAIGFALAFTFGFIAIRLSPPPLVGYLIAGVSIVPLRDSSRTAGWRDSWQSADVTALGL